MQTPIPEPTTPALTDPIAASLRHMMTSVLTALPLDPRGTPEDHAIQRHAVVAMLGAMHPNDPVEHMLAAHAASAHFAAMECFRLASLPDQPTEAAIRLIVLAEKMTRMSVGSVDRLKRVQGEAADRRRRAATIAPAMPRPHAPVPSTGQPETARQKPHAPAQPGATPGQSTRQPEAAQQKPHAPVPPASITAAQPAPQQENRPGSPLDQETLESALAGMTPEEQQAFAETMQLLNQLGGVRTGWSQPPARPARQPA